MLRRRLFAYTTMLVCGIGCAYVFCEMAEPFWASLLVLSVGVSIVKIPGDDTLAEEERRRLFIWLLAGFVLLCVNFIGLSQGPSEIANYELCGEVKEIRYKEYGYEIVVKPEQNGLGRFVRIAYVDEEHELENLYEIYSLIGDDIVTAGTLRKPDGRDNPGCFDNRLYMASRGIRYLISCKSISVEENISVQHKLHERIMMARLSFESCFDEERELRALVKGVVFGDKNEIDEDTREEFNANGTGHILAVSGLHIGFLFALLSMLLKKRRTLGMNILIVAVLLIYGEMTMWSPSTIRAVFVMTVSLASTALKRRADLLTSVSCAAMVLLINNPYELFNTGFQMSFIAMLGIAFIAKPLSYFVGDYLSVIIAVQLAIAPITAFLFHRISPLSVFINIPVTFVASVLVPVCIICIALIIIIGILPNFAYELACGLLQLIKELNAVLSLNGRWAFDSCGVNAGLLITFYILIFVISSEWMRVQLIRKEKLLIRKTMSFLIIPCLITCLAMFNKFADDELVFISVGQGDALHIRCSDYDLMIDGGGNVETNIGNMILKPYLLANNTKDLDAAVLTHLHTDHYKGLEELSEIYPVREIVLSKDYQLSYKAAYSNARFIAATDVIQVNDYCSIKPIWPVRRNESSYVNSNDANENNMVYMVNYKGVRILVTGDLLEEDELDMVQYYRNTDVLKCDILKVAHHGSKSSSSEAFLDAASPDIAVISVGKNNMYGHPHAQTIERLEERGIKIFRTDYNGAVGIDINRNGTSYKVDLMRQQWSDNGI